MKKLIILLCLTATVIIGYKMGMALEISSGSLTISSGALSIKTQEIIMWDDSGDHILWDASGDKVLWE